MKIGQVHRFGENVALFSGDGTMRYLELEQAKALAQALRECIADIEARRFQISEFATFSFETWNMHMRNGDIGD